MSGLLTSRALCHETQQPPYRYATVANRIEIFPRWRRPPSWNCSNRKRRSIRHPRKPHPRTKREVYRITRCGDMTIRVSWGHIKLWNPHFGGRGGLPGCARRPQHRETSIAFFSDSPLAEMNHFCSKRLNCCF